eukprot:5924251-Amphidinium_carterae.1
MLAGNQALHLLAGRLVSFLGRSLWSNLPGAIYSFLALSSLSPMGWKEAPDFPTFLNTLGPSYLRIGRGNGSCQVAWRSTVSRGRTLWRGNQQQTRDVAEVE